MAIRITPKTLIFIATAHLIGLAIAIPVTIMLALRFLLNPAAFWARRNYSALDLPAPASDVHHEMVDTAPGIAIHTVRTFSGAPTKPLLVMVHGFPEYWGSWRHQISEFRREYDIVCISPRGYCLSSKPESVSSYSNDKLAADLIAVIESLGAPVAALVGHDWGANISWHVAALRPDLMDKLIIACVPHPKCFSPNLTLFQRIKSSYMNLFLLPWLPEAYLTAADFKAVEGMFYGPPMGMRHPERLPRQELDCYKRELARPGAPTAAVNYYRAAFRQAAGLLPLPREWRQALKRPIEVPTLVLWAENDAALGRQLLRGTDRYVLDLRIEMLRNCSHWAQQDQPEEFNRLMREFLEGGSGVKAAAR